MIGNPFRYGDVATGSYFTNRARELAEVQEDIRSGQNIVIISPRRYGKTSLIFEAMDRLRRDHILVAYLDLFRAPTKDRFADLLASAIYAGLINPVERAWQNVVDLFQKLPVQPKVTIGADGTPSFEFSPGQRSRDIDWTIEELLALPGKIAGERRRIAGGAVTWCDAVEKAQKQDKPGEIASRVARPVTRQKAAESEVVEGFRKARAALEAATRDIAALRGRVPSRRR